MLENRLQDDELLFDWLQRNLIALDMSFVKQEGEVKYHWTQAVVVGCWLPEAQIWSYIISQHQLVPSSLRLMELRVPLYHEFVHSRKT